MKPNQQYFMRYHTNDGENTLMPWNIRKRRSYLLQT